MLAKRLYTVVLLTVLVGMGNGLLAQDTTNFFPHHVGDMWEYYVLYDGGGLDTLQVLVTVDSVGQDGFHYFEHERRLIDRDPIPLFTWWENFRQDSLNQIYTGLAHFYDRLHYRLNAPVGKLWIVKDLGAGYEIARVEDSYPDTIFGIPTTIKEIGYYATQDTSDTTIWLWQYTELLAGGFGTVFRGQGELELFYELFFKGAVIDGVVYGDTTLVGIENPPKIVIPEQFQLYQNYPNPFNPTTTIPFILNRSGIVTLTIYDLTGKEVIRLIDDQFFAAGEYAVQWNGENEQGSETASGVYFYQIIVGQQRLTRSMLLTR